MDNEKDGPARGSKAADAGSKAADAGDKYWLGFDLGGTKMLAVVYDSRFEICGKQRKKTKGFEGAESGVERIIGTIHDAVDDAGITLDKIQGIGIGCPGPVNLHEGVVVEAVNLGWKDVPLKKQLESALKTPVFVVNDVDGGVYGENRHGGAQNARCVVGIFPGTGIGGGCVYNNEILSGSSISAWEVGHICVAPEGPICGCGRRGCLETVASRLAIASEAAKAAYRGDAPALMKMVGTSVGDIRSGVLAKSIQSGDEAIADIIDTACEFLGRAMASITSLMIPDIFLLGGGLVEAMPERFAKASEKAARRQVMPALADTIHVRVAQLGDYATVLGVASWAQQQLS